MDIQATAKYIRISPRKMMLLADSVRSLPASQAVATLNFINKSGARQLRQVIMSAIANAKNRNLVSSGDLVFKTLSVQPGSAMKRFRAVSRGMAHSYKKKMSHVIVVLTAIESKLKLEKKTEVLDQKPKIKVQNDNVKS